jgi:ABC-2 type transport system ATP-binding protein
VTAASKASGPVVAAAGLVRSFGVDRAVDTVDLTVAAGETHALVGLNGAGKTTLMKMLLGMLRPDAGTVLLFGEPVGDAGPQVWSRVGHLLETPFGYGELTPTENVIVAARLHGVDVSSARRQAGEMIGELTLDRWADRRSRVLSLGNRQRLGLACALVHRPRVLILDEPTNGLDPMGVLELRRMLLSRSHGDGVGVLVSSHHLDEVARIADRITVMHRGRVIGNLDPGGVDLEHRFFDMVYSAERGGPWTQPSPPRP